MKRKRKMNLKKRTKEPKIDTKSRKQSNLSVANEGRIIYDPLAHVQLMMFDKFCFAFSLSNVSNETQFTLGSSIFPPESGFSQDENLSKNVCN